jgi:hypothetical protein
VEKVHREFDDITFKPGECVEEFALRISGLVNQLISLGDDLPDKKVAISMETLIDLDKMSIEVAGSHLQAVESHRNRKQLLTKKEVVGQQLLTEQQWKARSKAMVGEESDGSSSGGRGAGRGHGQGHGRCRNGDARSNSHEKREDGNGSDEPKEKCCYRCGKPDHFARECQSKKKTGQANLAQEEESTLMLLECCEIHFELVPWEKGDFSKSSVSLMGSMPALKKGDPRSSSASRSTMHPVEEKVFTHFNNEVKTESRRWLLDSRASNQMTGIHGAFTEIDTNVCNTVRFRDGSIVEIEGIGSILFVCRNGEDRVHAGVYMIPKLTTNIVSLGQLDELGYEVLIKSSVMWDGDES